MQLKPFHVYGQDGLTASYVSEACAKTYARRLSRGSVSTFTAPSSGPHVVFVVRAVLNPSGAHSGYSNGSIVAIYRAGVEIGT